jgi:hypothetical protein
MRGTREPSLIPEGPGARTPCSPTRDGEGHEGSTEAMLVLASPGLKLCRAW